MLVWGGGWPGVSGEAAAACCGRLLSLSVSWGSVKATTAAWPHAHGAENVVPLKISFFLFPSGFLRRVGATWGGRGVRAGSACHFSLHLGTSSASDTVRKGGKKKKKINVLCPSVSLGRHGQTWSFVWSIPACLMLVLGKITWCLLCHRVLSSRRLAAGF